MLLVCLALAFFAGEATAVAVVAVTGAVCASAAFELMCRRLPRGAQALCAAACVLLAAVPGAWIALPLAAYDLPRTEHRMLWLLGPICAVLPGILGTLGLQQDAVLLVCTVTAMTVSWRSTRELALAEKLHAVEDELSDKVLVLSCKNRELEEARASETQAAALAERTRIAREIHDSVGHMLTRLLLEVEALKIIHRDDVQAKEELEELSCGLNDAMSSMRRSVHALEDSSLDLGVELNRLGKESGIPHVSVSCSIEKPPSAEISRCLAGIVREALTNAARHAHAEHASIHMAELPGIWQLRVVNDGSVPKGVSGFEEHGMGLRGMRERVESLGGTFAVTADGKQFSVFASIPRRRTA